MKARILVSLWIGVVTAGMFFFPDPALAQVKRTSILVFVFLLRNS